jgi:hypothetical protein
MRRSVAIVMAVLVVLAAATQLVLPPYLEGRVERRLEDGGGRAEVSLSAVPAARLLFSHGGRIEIQGSGLRTDLRAHSLEKLDGFDEVDVRLTNLRAGPFEADRAELTRGAEDEPYRLLVTANVRPRDLSSYVGSQFGGALGSLFGGLAADALPFGNSPLPVKLDARVASEDGRPRVVSDDSTLAGLPTGPLAEALVGAIVSRL